MNLVILRGYCGDSAEYRTTQSGEGVMNVSLATTKRWKAENGEKKERTEWHRLVLFGKRATSLHQHITKGTHLEVTGELQTRKWQDKNGVDRWTTEVKINELEFIGGGKNSGERQDEARNGGGGYEDHGQAGGGSFEDDSIPF